MEKVRKKGFVIENEIGKRAKIDANQSTKISTNSCAESGSNHWGKIGADCEGGRTSERCVLKKILKCVAKLIKKEAQKSFFL